MTVPAAELSNQKFIVVSTLRMVGNRWLWSIMLGNANEARKSRVGYSRLPTEFLKPGNSTTSNDDHRRHFQVYPTCLWTAYPMILSVMQLTIVWILKTNAHTHSSQSEIYRRGNVENDWNSSVVRRWHHFQCRKCRFPDVGPRRKCQWFSALKSSEFRLKPTLFPLTN